MLHTYRTESIAFGIILSFRQLNIISKFFVWIIFTEYIFHLQSIALNIIMDDSKMSKFSNKINENLWYFLVVRKTMRIIYLDFLCYSHLFCCWFFFLQFNKLINDHERIIFINNSTRDIHCLIFICQKKYAKNTKIQFMPFYYFEHIFGQNFQTRDHIEINSWVWNHFNN